MFSISSNNISRFVPGMIIAIVTAIMSKIIAIYIPKLGAATIAILLGIVLGNTICKKSIFNSGTKLAESKLLEISVVLLGITITFQTITHIGLKGVIYIILQMLFTIIITYRIGKSINMSTNMSLLMAGGNAVCGSSAIASIAPAINAKEYEKGQVITIVNLLGTVMMLILPIIASFLYKSNIFAKSALIGGTLQSVGQVVASASMVSQETTEWAMIFKIMRIIMLVFVTISFVRLKKLKEGEMNTEYGGTIKKSKIGIPWYVFGFIICCFINSLVIIPSSFSQSASFISGWFEIIALAAIGLRLDFKKFLSEGRKFLIYGLLVGLSQIGLAVLFIRIFIL